MARGTDRTVGRRAGLVPLTIAIVSIALTGCAAGGPDASPGEATVTPEPTATVTVGERMAGSGPTEGYGVELMIPSDARSVEIAFECTGDGRYSVQVGDGMTSGSLIGDCGDADAMSWPLTDPAGSWMSVYLADDADWVASPTFSSAPFEYDDALTEDCAAFADAYSALMNADQGYTLYDAFDADEWTSRVDGAAADLADLAETAQPSVAVAIATLQAEASAPDRTVGEVLTDEAHEAIGHVSAACNRNQTPLVLSGEFGG